MLGLVVVHQDQVIARHPLQDGEVRTQYQPDEFAEFLARIPDSLIVGCHIAEKIKHVADHWDGRRPFFNMCGAPIRHPDGGRDWASIMSPEMLDKLRPTWDKPQDMFNGGIYVRYIGWKNRQHGAYQPKHFPVDPYTFARDNSSEQYRRMSVDEMVAWAADMHSFIEEFDLLPAPSFYKLSAQFLRNRFNEGHSHKLNERLRFALPGNYYLYNASPIQVYGEVLEVDQSNAHHHSAASLSFPLKSSVRQIEQVPWKDYVRKYLSVPGWNGVLHLLGEVPYLRTETYLPPPWNEPGLTQGYVYTNELEYLLQCGMKPVHVLQGWIGDERDPLPTHYGKWAMQQIAAASPSRKRWLKPTLLATYGMLAARPFRQISIWAHTENGGPRGNFHVGKEQFMSLTYKQNGEPPVPSRYANVIHRGMIEAETRLQTLKMAKQYAEQGFEVLALYADGIFVTRPKSGQMPLIAPPWRMTPITNAHFPHKGQVICDQYEKLPGVQGNLRKTYASEIRGLESERN